MAQIDKNILPNHVAIVPDGNRRWARARGLADWQGHWSGAEKTREQVQAAFDLGIYCLSWWGGSWSNLTERSKIEINSLFRIYNKYFCELIKKKEIYQHQVKVNVIGRWKEILPAKAKEAAIKLEEATKGHNQRLLNFFIAYDGRDEMISAVKSLAREARRNKSLKITREVLKAHLWTAELPPVDLLIRTGSSADPHNSAGFMMWLTANSQLYFSKGYYPDFGKKEFLAAIKEYQNRERRLGK